MTDDPKRFTCDNRVWANAEAREILNRGARSITRQEPEFVDDPSDPSLSEILRHIQEQNGQEKYADDGVFLSMLGEDISYRQMVYWYLFRYCGTDVTEILAAERGLDRIHRKDANRKELRNIEAQLTSVAQQVSEDVSDEADFL